MPAFFVPTYDEAWQAVSWVTFYLFWALVGQRAPDDRLYESGRGRERGLDVGAGLRRPPGLPRALRPGVAAAVAALTGGAAFVVHRDGGWAAHAPALALGVTALVLEAVTTWAQQHCLWLRVAAALRLAGVALAAAVVATFAQARPLAGALAAPLLVWALYVGADCALLWWWNRAALPSEVDEALHELGSTPLDPLPALGLGPPPPHAAHD